MRTETVTTMSYKEFETLVKDGFPGAGPYEFVEDMESSNDSCYKFVVKQDMQYSKWDTDKLSLFVSGKRLSYMTRLLFQELVNRGTLEPGTYFVEVSW